MLCLSLFLCRDDKNFLAGFLPVSVVSDPGFTSVFKHGVTPGHI